MSARKSLTPEQRREILDAQGGLCSLCGLKVSAYEKFEIDHGHALGLLGPDRRDNWFAVHKPCHTKKTKVDKKAIAKAKRLKKQHDAFLKRMETRDKKKNAAEQLLEKLRARDEEITLAKRQDP